MRNLRDLAKKAVTLCELMENRDKIETADIMKYHPDGITIRDYSNNIPTEFGQGVVYIFDEEKEKFAFGGLAFKNLFDELEMDYEGDVGELRKELQEKGLRVKLSSIKTKKGQTFTKIDVI